MNAVNPFLLGLQAADQGDFDRANAIAKALLQRNPGDVHAFQILGYAAFRQGRNADAMNAFLNANELAPGQPAILYWIGLLYKERGLHHESAKAFSEAVRINPKYGEAWCCLGEALYLLDRTEDATNAFEKALTVEPNSNVVLARASRHFEIIHDLERARALAEKAVSQIPRDEVAQIALAEINLREKRYEDVVERISPQIDPKSPNLRNQSQMSHLIAQAFEKLGKYDEAFFAYSEANRMQSVFGMELSEKVESPMHTRHLDRVINFLDRADLSGWKDPQPNGKIPVFLIGFVRSGTTWLDQILASHQSVAVMEEIDNFVGAWRDLILTDEGLGRFVNLSADEIAHYRDLYWQGANAALKEDRDKPVIVDKAPLNTAQLPLIARFFPEAKIIFALRDPRDCVMSAFQQHFQVNPAMAHFLDMRASAEFYDRVMKISNLVQSKMNLNIHVTRYESVVEKFDDEVRAVLDFLGLDWTDKVRNYQETAMRRAVRTPSARQVIQKPYKTSIGKWRNYSTGMAPALPILAPWVQRFGYDPD